MWAFYLEKLQKISNNFSTARNIPNIFKKWSSKLYIREQVSSWFVGYTHASFANEQVHNDVFCLNYLSNKKKLVSMYFFWHTLEIKKYDSGARRTSRTIHEIEKYFGLRVIRKFFLNETSPLSFFLTFDMDKCVLYFDNHACSWSCPVQHHYDQNSCHFTRRSCNLHCQSYRPK